MGELLYGKDLAEAILNEVGEEIVGLGATVRPSLVTVRVGADPASRLYHESQRRTAEAVGVKSEIADLPGDSSQKRVAQVLKDLNRDPSVHGIILHVPLPPQLEAKPLQWLIDSQKDVEGVTPCNTGRLFLGEPGLTPCTALSVMALIKATGEDLTGKEAVMVGRSDIVGKPVTIMLLQENCTVTVCHSITSRVGRLEEHVRRAEILIASVGKAGVIPGDWVRPGATVIDVGINAVGDKIVGDVEFDQARARAAYITPVPGGVGTVTTAYLMRNLICAVKWQKEATTGCRL